MVHNFFLSSRHRTNSGKTKYVENNPIFFASLEIKSARQAGRVPLMETSDSQMEQRR